MKHIKSILQLSMLAGVSAISAGVLSGCNNKEQNIQQNAFVIIEEIAPKKYKIKEQYPSDTTRVILKELNGTERILSQDEMNELIKQEEAKINNNTSNLTQEAQLHSGGLSLGEAILASAAGAIVGSWIGSKLFNNNNFINNQKNAFSNPSAYQRSVDSFNQKKGASARSGFFGGGAKASSKSTFGG